MDLGLTVSEESWNRSSACVHRVMEFTVEPLHSRKIHLRGRLAAFFCFFSCLPPGELATDCRGPPSEGRGARNASHAPWYGGVSWGRWK